MCDCELAASNAQMVTVQYSWANLLFVSAINGQHQVARVAVDVLDACCVSLRRSDQIDGNPQPLQSTPCPTTGRK